MCLRNLFSFDGSKLKWVHGFDLIFFTDVESTLFDSEGERDFEDGFNIDGGEIKGDIKK